MSEYGRLLTWFTVLAIGLGTLAISRFISVEPPTTTTVAPRNLSSRAIPNIAEDSKRSIMELRNQQDLDDLENSLFAPNLTNHFNVSWPGGILSFDEVAYQSYESVIFTVKESENFLVKFQANCDELAIPVHPSVREFWFGSEAFSAGVGPQILFISPPVGLVHSDITANFEIPSDKFDMCVESGGTVRFLVVKRLSDMVNLYMLELNYPLLMVPFEFAMTVAINLIQELRRLHLNAMIVHGDIHPGNILVDDRGNVQIVDYERARRNTEALDEHPSAGGSPWYHEAFSPWQIVGHRWSMRDDVFNALRTIAIMLNTDQYRVFESELARNPSELIAWKRAGFIFSVPTDNLRRRKPPKSRDPIESLGIPDSRKLQIRKSLGQVLDSVRSLVSVNEVPHYDSIIREFEHCRVLSR